MTRRVFMLGMLLMLASNLFLAKAEGWFEKEKEIQDEYLTKLFTPDFPHEYVKVVESEKGQRFIIVKARQKIDKDLLGKYYYYLLSRGVNIYGSFHYGVFSWQKTVSDFAITITRKVEGEPDTIEASESVVKDPKTGRPIVAATADGKEFRFAITNDLGKKWKKINLFPEKEPKEPFTRVGRYPGARLREVRGGSWLFFTSKDSFRDVAYYYEKKINENYSKTFSPLEFKDEVEQFEKPRQFSRTLKVFGIRTIAQRVIFQGYNLPNYSEAITLEIYRSLDPNLKDYIEIWIRR